MVAGVSEQLCLNRKPNTLGLQLEGASFHLGNFSKDPDSSLVKTVRNLTFYMLFNRCFSWENAFYFPFHPQTLHHYLWKLLNLNDFQMYNDYCNVMNTSDISEVAMGITEAHYSYHCT